MGILYFLWHTEGWEEMLTVMFINNFFSVTAQTFNSMCMVHMLRKIKIGNPWRQDRLRKSRGWSFHSHMASVWSVIHTGISGVKCDYEYEISCVHNAYFQSRCMLNAHFWSTLIHTAIHTLIHLHGDSHCDSLCDSHCISHCDSQWNLKIRSFEFEIEN